MSRPHTFEMDESLAIQPEWLKEELEMPGRSQSALARFLGLSSAAIVNRMCTGERKISAVEADKIRAYLKGTARGRRPVPEAHIDNTPDIPDADPLRDYVEVEVLPTFGGLGPGGTGDGQRETQLVPRSLVERELRSNAADLLIIDCRGDSMEPIFFNGDQVIIDRRHTTLAQPGLFALWDGDGYVIKNLQRDRQAGRIKVFAENPKYDPEFYSEGDDRLVIMGRPVWFARQL